MITSSPKRSMRLLAAEDSALLVIDVQERFRPAVAGMEEVIGRCRLLGTAANRLGLPVLLTEQYPKALGATVSELATVKREVTVEKLCFSAGQSPGLVSALAATGRSQIVLCGVEAHVCVLQSAFDILAQFPGGVYVVEDAVSSRKAADKEAALRRLRHGGVETVTTEMVIFEWLREAGTPLFKELQALVK